MGRELCERKPFTEKGRCRVVYWRREEVSKLLPTKANNSGLAVQNPDGPRRAPEGEEDLVTDILRQASDNGPTEPEPRQSSHAWGNVGHTLGSDEVDSVKVGEDQDEVGETQQRTLTFWREGFSIEDGPLHRYDEPGNRELLQAIQAGRAPMSLFDVRFDQPLQIVVQQRTNENYTPAPKVFKSFEGSGNRLGSVTPNISGANTPVRSTASPAPASTSAPAPAAKIELDASKPATNVQIRLGDGSRLVVRVNLDHTVANIRNYINAYVLLAYKADAHSTHPGEREYILQTTFPAKELSDTETIAEAKLQNAVVIQRFK